MDKFTKELAILMCKDDGKKPFDSYLINVGRQSLPEMERVENWQNYIVRAKRAAKLYCKAKEQMKNGMGNT